MSSSNGADNVTIIKDEESGEWWVFVNAHTAELDYQAALEESGAHDAELVEHGVADEEWTYMVFKEPSPVV